MENNEDRTAIILQASAIAIAIVGVIYVVKTLQKANA